MNDNWSYEVDLIVKGEERKGKVVDSIFFANKILIINN